MKNNQQSALSLSTESIKIYEKTYQLPVLNSPGFSQLQQQIKKRQKLIKAEKRETRETQTQQRFFGLFNKVETVTRSQPITFSERFQELERLIKDYNKIISFLTQHKQAYQVFFVQLTDELKGIVNKRCLELAQVEEERLTGLKEAENDPVLVELYQSQQQQIFRNAFILHRAAQLMLKKVDLINKSIQKLAEDQVEQKSLLENMVGKLGKYQKAYALQQKINKIEKDINKLADMAINFESIMSNFLGPFQGLIEQVVSIDEELSGTVEEIRVLAGDILNQDARLFAFEESESLSDSVVYFLVTSYGKRERIGDALENIRFETVNSLDELLLPPEVLENTSLTTALYSIQNDVESNLNQLRNNYTNETIDINDYTVPLVSEVELKSARNVHYTKLRDLLAAGKWKEADKETANVMLRVANRVSEGWLRESDIHNFPCDDLRTIDQLWVHYSKGKFGFSVQKKIYMDELGGTRDYNENAWIDFCDRVGWRKGGNFVEKSDLTFELQDTTMVGHLPTGGWGHLKAVERDGWWWWWGICAGCTSLAQRLVTCKI
ncbi:GUN4 domain-containing protein [Crocosphaera sp. Alani8]|uniref:GUN4 domain-containing protein n=1 Tax=Crocosphaera sp. Alani8 TaxID=3038952 RepID=UPI00313E64C6